MTVNNVSLSLVGRMMTFNDVSMFFGLRSHDSMAIWKDGSDVSMSMVWRVYDTAI